MSSSFDDQLEFHLERMEDRRLLAAMRSERVVVRNGLERPSERSRLCDGPCGPSMLRHYLRGTLFRQLWLFRLFRFGRIRCLIRHHRWETVQLTP